MNSFYNWKERSSIKIYFSIFLVAFLHSFTKATVIQLDRENIDSVLEKYEIVFVNFYADWCRFSKILEPIYKQASEAFENNPRVSFAAVNCDKQTEIGLKYHVNKYPTLKVFRNGELIKKEYRGQRSADALAEFISKQLEPKHIEFSSEEELTKKIDLSKRNIVGHFSDKQLSFYKIFLEIASSLRDDCQFYIGVGEMSGSPKNSSFFYFKQNNEYDKFNGEMSDYNQIKNWLFEKCIALVREITFENAEELTEEGKPFLILFRGDKDQASEEIFKQVVSNELKSFKDSVNFLMADGKRFAHPLHHLGKAEKDLPVIAIDSFRHMYLFSEFNDIRQPGNLRQFVENLHSGKLHREFHHGPDPVSAQQNKVETQPPPSVFKQLKPSENRYSLLEKEEL